MMPAHQHDEKVYMTPDACRRSHAPMHWMIGVVLVIVTIMAGMMASDLLMSNRAASEAATVRTELNSHQAAGTERDKSTDAKLDGLQVQIDRRFATVEKNQEKFDGKLDRVLDKLENHK